jgi:large subunit ribosomal protein L29
MAKISELRQLVNTDLETKLTEARKELFNLRFQLATGRLDNIARIAAVRKEIAQLMTLQREREIREEA